jgi:formylglycine-generating enzyme required for sulfatase activity
MGEDGFKGIAPTRQYAVNSYGLYDMGGNVWEWVSDWYSNSYYIELSKSGKVARNPKGPAFYSDPSDPYQKKKCTVEVLFCALTNTVHVTWLELVEKEKLGHRLTI